MMRGAPAAQLDMLALLAAEEAGDVPRCLYRSRARGVPARQAEWQAWRDRYGNFGSGVVSHAWYVHTTCPEDPTGRCQATVLHCDLRESHASQTGEVSGCDCAETVDAMLYRGACTGCDWEGPERPGENAAAEDAVDHAWPGWRDLPVVPRCPQERNARARWVERVTGLYPAGWLQARGPIRTSRERYGTRHVPGLPSEPHGYDMSATEDGDPA